MSSVRPTLGIGSSPRTRGTWCWRRVLGSNIRFIPAHAGNIIWGRRLANIIPVHPRARGEHRPRFAVWIIPSGSSPRTRGTYHMGPIYSTSPRFIPAHAGNIEKTFTFPERKSVHPRARGEHGKIGNESFNEFGSSPRTRGTCVWVATAATGSAVHPRARGEHSFSNFL